MAGVIDRISHSQRVASDPQKSAWVAANAGSGKTHVLVNRIIRLMLDGADPGKILALTFTKAAAAEMANRLNQRLAGWAMLPLEALSDEIADITGSAPAPDQIIRARRLFAHALETPGGLKIQTIHAFCERVLHRFALEANVAPNFDILDDRTSAELLNEARDKVLATFDDGGQTADLNADLKVLAGALSAADFDGLIAQVLKRRNLLRTYHRVYGTLDNAIAKLRETFGLVAEDTIDSLLEEAIGATSPVPDMLSRLIEFFSAGTKTDVQKSDTLIALRDGKTAAQKYQLYKSLYFTKAGTPAKRLVTAKLAASNEDLTRFLEDEQERIGTLDEKFSSLRIVVFTGSLLRIADKIINVYEAAKSARALLDYDDLIERTAALLSQTQAAAWVLYKLDNGIDHILVDEAQDTSPEQWQVVSALSNEFFSGAGARDERRTIFAVGDEKQSIFGFQGASPAEFDRMRRQFQTRAGAANRDFEKVELTVSFRSTHEILAAVDLVFEQDLAKQGMTSFGATPVHEAIRDGQQGLVEIWPTEKPDDQDATDPWDAPLDYTGTTSPRVRLARKIAATIKGWIDSEEMLEPRGRKIRAGDILILVRRRNNFVDAMVEALKTADVPVAGIDRMRLSEQLAVMDLLAVARFVLLPQDDLNLATVLKGPLFGFSDEDLFDLAYERPATLWQAMNVDGQNSHVSATRDTLANLLKQADRIPPYEFFANLLNANNGRQKFIARLGFEVNDPLDEFLNLCLDYESTSTPSLQGFIAWFSAADVDAKRNMDNARNEVRIMTVHGAKGLEANIVFLPDTCHRIPDGSKKPKILMTQSEETSMEPQDLLMWRPNKTFENSIVQQSLAEIEKAEIEEYNRLLYVAMTRAQDRLYITGYEGKQAPSERCWYHLIASALKPAAVELHDNDGNISGWQIKGAQSATPAEKDAVDGETVKAVEPPPWARAPVRAEKRQMDLVSPSRLAVAQEDAEDVIVEPPVSTRPSPLITPPEERFLRGRLIHKLLEYAPGAAPETYGTFCNQYLQRSAPGYSTEVHARIVDEVQHILQADDFAPLFDANGLSEVPIVGRVHMADADGPVKVSGRIDRLIVSDNEVIAIDFKTDRAIPHDAEAVAIGYKRQMAVYRHLLAQIFPDHQIICHLLWTQEPRLMELPEDTLLAAIDISD